MRKWICRAAAFFTVGCLAFSAPAGAQTKKPVSSSNLSSAQRLAARTKETAESLAKLLAMAESPADDGSALGDTLQNLDDFDMNYVSTIPFPGAVRNVLAMRKMEQPDSLAKSYWQWQAVVPFGPLSDTLAVFSYYSHIVDSLVGHMADKKGEYDQGVRECYWNYGKQTKVEIYSRADTAAGALLQLSITSEKRMPYDPFAALHRLRDYYAPKIIAGLQDSTALTYYLALAGQLQSANIRWDSAYNVLKPLFQQLVAHDLRLALRMLVFVGGRRYDRMHAEVCAGELKHLLTEDQLNELGEMVKYSTSQDLRLTFLTREEKANWSQTHSNGPYKIYITCPQCKGAGGWTKQTDYQYLGLYHDFESHRTDYYTCGVCRGTGVVEKKTP